MLNSVEKVLMISENGTQFLTQLILNDYKVEQEVQRLAYYERVTVALDLQILIKQLVKEIEDKTGENLISAMFWQGERKI